MEPRKIPRSRPIEWDFDDLFGFRDFFDDVDDQFARMRRHMGRLVEQARRGELPPPEKGGPCVYGWTFRVDDRGKPRFEEFGNVPGLVSPARTALEPGTREPLVDVMENEKTVTVTAEVPGVEKEDVHLETSEEQVTIRVDRKDRKYFREVDLPCPVKPETAKATCKNGVLQVVLERAGKKPGSRKVRVD
ncbi:MAG: archaeal heat shock protein Hsp20 [Halobacteria archaeon]